MNVTANVGTSYIAESFTECISSLTRSRVVVVDIAGVIEWLGGLMVVFMVGHVYDRDKIPVTSC